MRKLIFDKLFLSFIAVIHLYKYFPNQRNRGAYLIFVLGVPISPLLVHLNSLNNIILKYIFLVHLVLFFVINYLCVRILTEKSIILMADKNSQIPIGRATVNVLIVQTIHAGIHYSIFKGYQWFFS